MFPATPDKTWLNGFGTMERVNPSSDHGSSKSRFDRRRSACNGNAQNNGWILNQCGQCHRPSITLRFRDRTQLDVEGTSSLPSVSFVAVANGSPSGIIIVTPELACSTLALAVVPASIIGIERALRARPACPNSATPALAMTWIDEAGQSNRYIEIGE
jgi:hypothetical protein